MITKIRTKSELYVFINGRLIYKRWFAQNKGRMFHEKEGYERCQ